MWETIVLTVAATSGNNIGKALQKKGTLGLPQLAFNLKVLRIYALSKLWIAGFCIDILGALLMLRAVSQATGIDHPLAFMILKWMHCQHLFDRLSAVSVIQPVSGCGLAVLSVFSHFYLKEPMNLLDWLGVAMAAAGTVGVGIIGEEQDVSRISFGHLTCFILLALCFFYILNGWLHLHKRRHRPQELNHTEVIEEIVIGLEAGALFGLAAALSRMGFILSEQGFSKLSIPIGIILSICCSGSGFFFQTKGLKHGRAIVVSTCAAVSSIVTGVLVGMFALGEVLPIAPLARMSLFFGWSLIIFGVLLLMSSHRLILFLPRRLRPFFHGKQNTHKNSHLSRSGSSRIWEPSPSSFVTMSPMNLHSQTSMNKVKS